MKKNTIIAILFLITSNIYGQNLPLAAPTLSSGWQRINLKNVGTLDIPPTMEIQGGEYKEQNNKLKSYLNIDEPSLVVQQKGLNDYNDSSFKKYARVILNTDIGSVNDFEKLDFDIYQFTSTEKEELTNYLKQSYTEDLKRINQRIITFYPVKFEKINNMSAMHISYVRQLTDQPQVKVDVYIFQNNDRAHKLTLSYRLNEAEYWKADLAKVLSSFRITNIK